jgi:hypothetical protein
MSTSIDQEIEAIKTLLTTLEPLDPKVRESVLDYVLRRLDISLQVAGMPPPEGEVQSLPPGEAPSTSDKPVEELHIKDLVNEKKPRSAIEMATLVAYYLSHKAPKKERKQTITTKDIETYFKIGEFKLPTKPQFTLPNTKGAGYLDAIGTGEYKLNPVGYNLVVHSMPKSKKQAATKRIKRQKNIKKASTKA